MEDSEWKLGELEKGEVSSEKLNLQQEEAGKMGRYRRDGVWAADERENYDDKYSTEGDRETETRPETMRDHNRQDGDNNQDRNQSWSWATK